jgi:hypothetical protein
MGYYRQTSAKGVQNLRLDVAPFLSEGSGAVTGTMLGALRSSARAIGLGGARGMRARKGVANVMVAGLFATEASYEGCAVQSLARSTDGCPRGCPVRHAHPAGASGRAIRKIVQHLGETRR